MFLIVYFICSGVRGAGGSPGQVRDLHRGEREAGEGLWGRRGERLR